MKHLSFLIFSVDLTKNRETDEKRASINVSLFPVRKERVLLWNTLNSGYATRLT